MRQIQIDPVVARVLAESLSLGNEHRIIEGEHCGWRIVSVEGDTMTIEPPRSS